MRQFVQRPVHDHNTSQLRQELLGSLQKQFENNVKGLHQSSASASISISMRGSIKARTSTMVAQGRI
ncbi:MAG: hypothetical protein JO028_22540 [Acidobacteriaceae bacterium]|nr:hypothetical protein [Acidobacteriaceae bacterium]